MTSETKRTAYNRVSQERATMRSAAVLLGWSVLDVLGAYLTPEGDIVVVTRDGKRYGARAETPDSMRPTEPLPKRKAVYAPKSWNPNTWNSNRDKLIDLSITKASALHFLEQAADAKNDPDDAKRLKHFKAVLDALPDVPEWAELLPVAPVSDGSEAEA